MPKRKRSAGSVRDSAVVAGDNNALTVLPANNLPDGTGELLVAANDAKGGIAGVREWYAKIAEVAPIPEAYPLMAKFKSKEEEIVRLIAEAEAIPQANRRYNSDAIEQWQGLTPPIEDVICRAVLIGLTRQKAAQLAGFKLSKLKLWLQLGAKGYSPFANFRARFLRLEVASELEATARVELAAATESKAASVYLRLLERRFKVDEGDDEEYEDILPTEQFTVEELQAFVDSKGEIVPRRFTKDYIDAQIIRETE